MQPMHPAIADAMIQARLADASRRAGRAHPAAGASSSGGNTANTRRHSARRAAGWWLVNLGFRLALPRHPAVRSITSVAR
jgi:hypothetical protein